MEPSSVHRRALLSLHDVTPFHLPRLQRAEAVLEDLGVEQVAYLLIPDYHGFSRADTPEFIDWCRRERPFKVEWVLHGYYHRETEPGRRSRGPLGTRLKRRFATGGEGEFLSLHPTEARSRVEDGIEMFERVIGDQPRGFVPPAWLHTDDLAAVLYEAGFDFWESRAAVHDLRSNVDIAAPVITWATRTLPRRWTSIGGTPILRRLYRRRALLRLAVHPFDFDFPATEKSIRRVWASVLDEARQESYAALVTHA